MAKHIHIHVGTKDSKSSDATRKAMQSLLTAIQDAKRAATFAEMENEDALESRIYSAVQLMESAVSKLK